MFERLLKRWLGEWGDDPGPHSKLTDSTRHALEAFTDWLDTNVSGDPLEGYYSWSCPCGERKPHEVKCPYCGELRPTFRLVRDL